MHLRGVDFLDARASAISTFITLSHLSDFYGSPAFSSTRYKFLLGEFLEIISPINPARNNCDPMIIAVNTM